MGPEPVVNDWILRAHAVYSDAKVLTTFFSTVAVVRRVLANIPTYMICDDHEITDDWNMTRRFCDYVYSNVSGRRIIQNGLIAFSICQSWGNLPEQFWDGSQAAGALLLKSIEAVTQMELGGTHVYHLFDSELQQRVGIHDAATIAARSPYGVFHDSGANVVIDGAFAEHPGYSV